MKIYFYHPSPIFNTASFRLRCYYPSIALKKIGYNVENGNDLNIAKDYDVVIFSKAYSYEILAFIKSFNGKTIFDLCDNHFIKSESHKKLLIDIIQSVDSVTTSTSELSNIIFKYTQKKANVIFDSLDYWVSQENENDKLDNLIENIMLKTKYKTSNRSLWFGNAGSNYSNFGGIGDVFIFKKYLESSFLYVVTKGFCKSLKLLKNGVFPIYYSFSNEILNKKVKIAKNIILPIRKNDFTIIKSENRLLTSILMGKDIIYTQIPSYKFLESYSKNLENDTYSFKFKNIEKKQLKDILQPYTIESVGEQWKKIIEA